MKILLVAATPEEILPTVTWLREEATATDRNVLTFPGCSIEILFTGMGPMTTAFALGQILRPPLPQLAIQAGLAGAVDRSLELGTVVQVDRERLMDHGAEDRDGALLSPPDIGFPFSPPFGDDGILRMVGSGPALPFPTVAGGTVSKATGSAASVSRLREQFPEVQVETMEGAAFFYAIRSRGVAGLQLRAISNYVEERNRAAWQIDTAVRNLNKALRKVLQPFLGVRAEQPQPTAS
ncbi:futalosine hydrolase [Lewinella marina]|uniref:Futalosine hydrolase n=1 Tax=Neolewinella marina TaxID=438751 RepID=A0A2G0CFP2_9BACT|nr:futalosine hydrolase [Neolewinella marina]NJB85513.1 futalosine hydrolase [Neolewinella marina]PHK98798.1 futalosine hydrolase [Neolewinella marina]